MQNYCSIDLKDTGHFLSNEKKTKWVTIITLVTMFVEVGMGYWTGSMSLLADGWHMASHTVALFLSLVVYYLYRNPRFKAAFTFGGGKILSLGGYTSSLMLIFIAVSMVWESVERLRSPLQIHYQEALLVAVVGLVVNLVCALILHQKSPEAVEEHQHDASCSHKNKLSPAGHSHSHSHAHSHGHGHGHNHAHDHNHESAYVHILTDALTSVLAIVALMLGAWKGWTWLDPAVGILGGIVVFKWSLGLIRQSGMDLLDAHDGSINRTQLIQAVEGDGSTVLDVHLWKLGPGQVGCELVVRRNLAQTSMDYRNMIQKKFDVNHLIIEVV